MRNDDAQMLLLTGIIVILISIAAASISSDLSNIEVKISSEESHPLYQEFLMIKEKINDLYGKGKLDIGPFAETIDDLQFIEVKYGIDIYATLDLIDPNIIYLCLEDGNTKICERFVMT